MTGVFYLSAVINFTGHNQTIYDGHHTFPSIS